MLPESFGLASAPRCAPWPQLGRTPLHLCCSTGNELCAKLLLLAGADFNAVDVRCPFFFFQREHISESRPVALSPLRVFLISRRPRAPLRRRREGRRPSISPSNMETRASLACCCRPGPPPRSPTRHGSALGSGPQPRALTSLYPSTRSKSASSVSCALWPLISNLRMPSPAVPDISPLTAYCPAARPSADPPLRHLPQRAVPVRPAGVRRGPERPQ